MPIEEWTVSAKLLGEFYLDGQYDLGPGTPIVEGLRRLGIRPDPEDDKEWTGRHTLAATLAFDRLDDAEVEAHVVYERAKHLVASITSLASIGVGRPIWSSEMFVSHSTEDDPPRIRRVMGLDKYASVAPPAPLPPDVLSGAINPKILRVIHWWSRGITTQDSVDGLMSLINAADLISGTMDGVPGRTRTCEKCGAEQSRGPLLRERIVFFLTSVGVEEALAEAIYKSRSDVAHAGTHFLEDDLRRYREHATVLAEAVRTGVARTIGITLPPLPIDLPLDVASAFIEMQGIGESPVESGAEVPLPSPPVAKRAKRAKGRGNSHRPPKKRRRRS